MQNHPFINSLGMKFVPVPGTDVLFCIHPTRKADYRVFRDEVPGRYDAYDAWRSPKDHGVPVSEGEDHPVVCVTWDDARSFCYWLSGREGLNYRLPTDHEWSCAVGIGDRENPDATPKDKNNGISDVYPWGTQWPPPKGAGNFADETWGKKFRTLGPGIKGYNDGYATTSPVMLFQENRLGLYDLAGNVWELCQDWYDSEKKFIVLRGGSWHCDNTNTALLASHRGFVHPSFRDAESVAAADGIGFRLVLEVSGS